MYLFGGVFAEKLFRSLKSNVVPVVMATKDVRKIAPPNSYIDVRDFKSPKHLAEYLLYLDKNDTAYMEYFKWQRDYTVVAQGRSTTSLFCRVCSYIYQHMNQSKTVNIRNWLVGRSHCTDKDSQIRFWARQLRIEDHFGFHTFWTEFCNILKYWMNLKFEAIVQIFRKIIQLNTVIFLKSTNNYYRKLIQKVSSKCTFILLSFNGTSRWLKL